MRTETLIESEYDELGKPTASIDKTENIVYNYRCNGSAITYDNVGNPLLYRGHTLGWSRIRLLTSWDSLSFAYNANGIRTRKGDTTYELDGNSIISETTNGNTIRYYYGNGGIVGFRYNGARYYYEKNLQGDITAIYSENGQLVGSYTYDAWGNHTVDCDVNGIASLNPFCYRAYYYDTETGLYYLKSRYYDPEIGRFINADEIPYLGASGGILGYHLFAYCENNPSMYNDSFGLCAKAWFAGYQGPCPGEGLPGCMDNRTPFQGVSNIVLEIDQKSPPDHPAYTPPKNDKGQKVRNPNGPGWGWPAKDGGVWVPTPNMHGGECWTIQYPGGDHSHAYPGGGVRNHFELQQSTGESILMVLGGIIVTAYLLANDFTGFGVADDSLLVGSTACFAAGIDGLTGKKVCTVCGEVKYGY